MNNGSALVHRPISSIKIHPYSSKWREKLLYVMPFAMDAQPAARSIGCVQRFLRGNFECARPDQLCDFTFRPLHSFPHLRTFKHLSIHRFWLTLCCDSILRWNLLQNLCFSSSKINEHRLRLQTALPVGCYRLSRCIRAIRADSQLIFTSRHTSENSIGSCGMGTQTLCRRWKCLWFMLSEINAARTQQHPSSHYARISACIRHARHTLALRCVDDAKSWIERRK